MSLDSTLKKRAFGTKRPDGRMTVAYTEVMAADDLNEDYAITISELPPTRNTFPQSFMIFNTSSEQERC